MQTAQYIETNCTIEHEDRTFEAGGAVVADQFAVAYLGKDGVLTDWHGETLGTYRITATWKTPRSFVSGHMHQVVASVGGRTYTGRSAGVGMIFRGRVKKG